MDRRRDKIQKILIDFSEGEIWINKATNDILALFNVEGQSGQLLALAQYMCEHQNNLDGKTAKDYLQDFLSQ